jgi:predicted PurR-regulated permease PerM
VGVGVVVVAAFWLTVRLMTIVLPVVVAVLLASLLWPGVRWLQRRGVPDLLAVWGVLLGMLGAIAGATSWIVPTVSGETGPLRTSVGDGVTRIENWLVTGPFHLDQGRVDAWSASLRTQFGSFESEIARGALAQTPLALEVVGGAVLSFVLLFYVLRVASTVADLSWVDRWGADPRVAGIWDTLSGFTRGLVVNATINAVLLGVALWILGVPLAGPIAAVTFLASFVPLVGAIVSGALAALVALVAVGPGTAAIVVAVTVAIHHIEAYVVGPRVIGHRTGLHPVVLILAIAIGLKLAGVAGAFLAGPSMAAVSGWFAADQPTGPSVDA